MTPFVLWIQGMYYLATGLWALVDVESFQQVTGPKVDVWLVKTVGVLVCVIGLAILRSGMRKRLEDEAMILAGGCAISLISIDIFYAFKGIIPKIYLLDAIVELAFLVAVMALFRSRTLPKVVNRVPISSSSHPSATVEP